MKTSVITAEWSGVPCTGISMHMVPPYFNPTPYPRPSATQPSPEPNSYFLVRAEVVKNVWISPGSRHQQLAVTWGWRGSVAGTSSVTLTFRWEMWRLGSTQLSTSHNVWTSQHFLWKIWRLPQSSFWLGKRTDNADNVWWRPSWRATETWQTPELLRPGEVTSLLMQGVCYQHYQDRILYTIVRYRALVRSPPPSHPHTRGWVEKSQ